jgi:hypothetical protein
MGTNNPASIVEGYLRAVAEHDQHKARRYLRDRGFSFISPIASFNSPDAFTGYLDAVGAILQRMETRHRFVDGGTVCHVFDVTTSMGSYKTQPVVHLVEVADGSIVRIEVIFDASEYHRMIENRDGTVADRPD